MQAIETGRAPAAIGPYAQAITAGGFVWCSGQIGLDPATGELAGDDAVTQARRALENLAAVLDAAGSSLASVVKTTVYVTDLREFAAMNEVYAEAFGDHRPARATVEVSALPKGARVEIECLAACRDNRSRLPEPVDPPGC